VATILQKLGLTYVAMVTTNDTSGLHVAKRMKEVSKEHGICMDVMQTIDVSIYTCHSKRLNVLNPRKDKYETKIKNKPQSNGLSLT